MEPEARKRSPSTRTLLEKKGVVLSKSTRRSLRMGEKVIGSLSEQINIIKPVGGATEKNRKVYNLLRSLVNVDTEDQNHRCTACKIETTAKEASLT